MKTILLVFTFISSIHITNAQGWGQTQKLVASDRDIGAEFGFSVAMDGNYAVIGAHLNNNPNISEGAAYIFMNDGSGNWTEIQKLTAPDKRSNDFFGFSVAIDGNTIIVGARAQDYDEIDQNFMEAAGAVYVFENDGNTWNFIQKLVAPDRAASDVFGESVAVSGDYAIIMAPLEDEDENGNNTINAAGSGYIFERDATGTWNFVQKIVVSNRAEADTIGRERSVAIDGNTIVIGVQLNDTDENNVNEVDNAGAVYVFERNGSGIWSQTQKIVASTRIEDYRFGNDVGIDGDFMVVGSAGRVNFDGGPTYVLKKINDVWQEIQQLLPSITDSPLNFGNTVDIEGDQLVVGAYSEAVFGFDSAGAAYVFENDGSDTWGQTARIAALDAESQDNLSFDITISGDFIIGGAYREDEDANGQNPLSQSGSAYVFDVNEPNTIPNLGIIESEPSSDTKVYPNPFTDVVHLDFTKTIETLNIHVYDVLGNRVFSEDYNLVQNVQLDLNLSKGIYMLKAVTNHNDTSVVKLIRQ